jgi:hypothetical protein
MVLSTLAGESRVGEHTLTVGNLCDVIPACLSAVVVMKCWSVESISDTSSPVSCKVTGIRSQMLVITDAMNLAVIASY